MARQKALCRPRRLGTLKIGVTLIFWGLLLLLGQPLQAQTPPDEAVPPDFFIETAVDNLTPYVGQQITYRLHRYQARDFPGQPHYEDRPFDGFLELPLLQRPTFTATIGGREYRVHPTFLALFPNRPGPFTIEPARLVIPDETAGTETIIQSEPVNLQVRPLPPGAPEHFNGAVGQFEIEAWFDQPAIEVNQPVNLNVEIRGTGNIERLLPPEIPSLEHWYMAGALPMAQITTDLPLSKDTIEGTRRFQWPVAPTQAGEQFYPAIRFSYFDPLAGDYQSIRTDPIQILVRPSQAESTFTSPAPGLKLQVQRLSVDIRHIKPVPATLTTQSNFASLPLIYGLCAALPILAVSGIWLWQQRRQQAGTPRMRRQTARRQARKRLAAAQHASDAHTLVQQALTGYLADKLDRPIVSLTVDQLQRLFNQIQLDPRLAERIQALLARTEAGRFAPTTGQPETARTLIATARVLIDDLETFFAKRGR